MIEIPYLTVNAADVGLLETEKHIDRGGLIKLFSTYNNGNIYGIATLLLLPIYDCIEQRKVNRLLVRAALILTLSRTVWVGLVLEQAISTAESVVFLCRNFPIIRTRALVKSLGGVALIVTIIGAVVSLAFLSPLGATFLTDSSLGGRADQLHILHGFSLLPTGPYSGFSEMVFLAALRELGFVGFVLMLLLFLCPLSFAFVDKGLLEKPLRRAAVKGLLLYSAVAWIDGAIDYIPVMAIYWFVVVVAIYGCDYQSAPVTSRKAECIHS